MAYDTSKLASLQALKDTATRIKKEYLAAISKAGHASFQKAEATPTAEEAQENLPEECSQPNPDCRCSADSSTGKSAQTGCVFLTLGLGRTTPWTDARPLALKVFEMKASPMLFTPESLYVTLDYAYKGVGNADLPDGTPREVFARGDELMSAGLDVPQVTRVAMALRDKGIAINPAVYTVDELSKELVALKRGGGKKC